MRLRESRTVVQLIGLPGLIGLCVFFPRALDVSLGVVCLAGAACGLFGLFQRLPVEQPWGIFHPIILIGLFGLFGGGSIAWGWITAARVAAGCACFVILVEAVFRWLSDSVEPPEGGLGEETSGCALILGLFAATGWLGLFPTYLEQELWPPTLAGGTVRGICGYLGLWLVGLTLIAVAVSVAHRGVAEASPTPRRSAQIAAGFAALGFVAWIGGAVYFCCFPELLPWAA